MTSFNVPGPSGLPLTLSVEANRPLFVVGRNGTGKSALMNWLHQRSSSPTVYLPGSRTALFDGESLNLTPNSRRDLTNNLLHWDRLSDARWKNQTGNQRNEKAIHDLVAAEQQYKHDCANTIAENADEKAVADAILKLQSAESPLDNVNQLLEQANIAVRVLISENELKAEKDGNVYSYARMSDGERIALILIAEIIAAKAGVVFLIDEPELHLHRLIVTPLVATVVRSRPDCSFIISTHELDLPTTVPNSRVCMVRSVEWGEQGAINHWDFDIVEKAEDLPEELALDILGSRRRVLFVEGVNASLDVPMYSVLFPSVSVRSKGSCRDVQQAVAGIRATQSLHHTEAFGIIDNDGMNDTAIANLEHDGIFALPFYSVESLYYDPSVLTAVASRQAATLGADEEKRAALTESFLANVVDDGITAASMEGTAEHMAGRIAERQVRDSLLSQMPKRDELIKNPSSLIQLSIASLYPEELARYQAMLAAREIYSIVARYPVRHSNILGAMAKALKFQSRSDYEAAALARVSSDHALAKALLLKLSSLSTTLS